ncbi:hypothetical protein E8K88_11895 [Lampropedia aestuarii]|uniref:DUF968 domain-containing protein n=1 Tax=Lampropedia aestuarii TaxID=2562762 RepID=A0A4S5BIZ7_9BURK|nr:Ref family recombination enhancement nuclease [Lampropedia aestuarii]THJ32397.1 hypothetical protein E8K88_11895 [Lampropedia aestuarii]
MKKNATRAEREYMGRVAALGCFVCRTIGYGETMAVVHHVREGSGMAQRPSHFLTVPLCPRHHDNHSKDGIHGGREEWRRHGLDEMDALADTIQRLAS